MTGPFDWLAPNARRGLFLTLTVLLVATSAVLAAAGNALVTEQAPQGIVSYEFAGDAAGARRILDSWDPRARENAMFVLGLDYLYLLLYPAWFSLACSAIARRLGGFAGRLGLVLSWAVLAAAPLDALENYGSIRLLVAGPSDAMARLAWACAAPKFALVAAATAYLLGGGVAVLWRGRSA